MGQSLLRWIILLKNFLGPLLDAGADGIIANTIKITNKSKYKEMHAIKVIHDIRCAIDRWPVLERKMMGQLLIVAGDVNNTGRIVRAAALGADIIGYSTRLIDC